MVKTNRLILKINKRYHCRLCQYSDANSTRAHKHLAKVHPTDSMEWEEHDEQVQYIERKQFDILKQQVDTCLKKTAPSCSDSLEYLHNLTHSMNNQIMQVIQSKLFEHVGVMSVEELRKDEHTLRTNLLNVMQTLDFKNVLRNWNSSFQLVKNQILNALQKDSSTQTLSRYKKGFKILEEFSYQELFYQLNVIDSITQLSHYDVRCFRDCYNRVSKLIPIFSLPTLPPIISKINSSKDKIKKTIGIEEVKLLIQKCFDVKEYELGVDLWFTTVMGLRKSELMRVWIKIGEGKYACGIKLLEQKNRHEALRLIPISLIKIAEHFSISYPISNLQRFRKLRRFALDNLGTFYNLRHVCFTNIVKNLYENTAIARFHESPNTSIRYYIDQRSLPLIDSAFSLSGTQNLDVKSDIRVNQMIQITSTGFNLKQMATHQFNGFNFEKYQLQKKDEEVQKLGNDEFSETFQNIEQLIHSQISSHSLIMDKAFQVGDISTSNVIQVIKSQIKNLSVVDCSKGSQIDDVDKGEGPKLLISNNFLSISEIEPFPAQKYSSEIGRLQKRCPACRCGSVVVLESCDQCSSTVVRCHNCKLEEHDCYFEKQLIVCRLQIEKDGKIYESKNLKQSVKMKNKNNIESKIIQRSYKKCPFSFEQCHVDQSVPRKFKCRYAQANEKLLKQLEWIESNQDFLPLQIKKSDNGEGDGVFATSKYNTNCLVCTYRGQIRTNDTTNYLESDSVFEIGWVGLKNLSIDAYETSNVGRFINSRNSPEQANLSPQVVVTQTRIIIFFITTKNINIGQQLLYNYGSKYWAKN